MIQNVNSDRTTTQFAVRCIYLLVLICGFLINDSRAQEKPLKHFVPPGESINRIPRPIAKLAIENDFVGKTADGDERVRLDKMVFKATYNGDDFGQPNRDNVTSTNRPVEYPWTYRLQNLPYERFEAKLAEIWGDRLLGSALDNEQRTVRIFFPEGETAPEASMKFDRVTGELTYEGAPSRKRSWYLLMQTLDRNDNVRGQNAVKVIDISTIDQSFVRHVSAVVQGQDQEQVPGQNGQLEVPLAGLSEDDFKQIINIVPELDSQVEVTVNEQTGTLILRGKQEDLDKITQFIAELFENAAMLSKETRLVPLFNTQPVALSEQIQGIYDEQFVDLHGSAIISAVTSSNSLFVVGSKGAVATIENMIRKFDGPAKPKVDPGPQSELSDLEKGFRNFRLKHISADTAKRVVDEFFGQATSNQATEPRAPLPVTTIIERRTNSITIIAGPDLLKRAAALLKEIDIESTDGETKRSIRVFQIRNQIAGDLAVILQDILNGGQQQNVGLTESQIQANNLNQNTQLGQGSPDSLTPIANLEINDSDGRPIHGGNLFDARITSNNASNTIAVTAPELSMGLIAELIRQLDRLPDAVSEVKVFPIKNGDATEILATLEALFTGGQQGGNQQQGSIANLPLQSPGGDGSSLLNIRFAINERTNTIIASGSASDLEFVEALISRLDEKDIRDRQMSVYRLSNASVTDVAAAINTMLDARTANFSSNPLAGAGPNNGGVNLARREVIVVEEPTSNSLIIYARPEYMAEIEHIIKALDRRAPMVKVKAMIVQVDLNQLENFGVEFGLQDSSIFDAGLSDSIGTGFLGLDNPAGQLISSLGVGRQSVAAGIPGLVLSAGDESLNFVLRFLTQKGCAKVLFSPAIMTMENLEGRLNQGASIQRATGTTNTNAGVTQSFVEIDIGITLAITPRVSPDGMIVMFVDVQNSSLGAVADGTVIGTDANGAQVVSRPINQTVAQSTIMARSGQTVAISGLIQESKSQSINSIPILGDLPVIGPLFQSVENTADRTELLIILTPYIVDGSDDISAMNEDDFSRMHWCECDVAELYGNTSYTGTPYREQTPKTYYPDVDPTGDNPQFELGDDDEFQSFGDGQGTHIQNGDEQVYPQENGWRNREHGSGNRNGNEGFKGSATRNELPLPPASSYREPAGQSMRIARQPNYGQPQHNRNRQNYEHNNDWRKDDRQDRNAPRQTTHPQQQQSYGQQSPRNYPQHNVTYNSPPPEPQGYRQNIGNSLQRKMTRPTNMRNKSEYVSQDNRSDRRFDDPQYQGEYSPNQRIPRNRPDELRISEPAPRFRLHATRN